MGVKGYIKEIEMKEVFKVKEFTVFGELSTKGLIDELIANHVPDPNQQQFKTLNTEELYNRYHGTSPLCEESRKVYEGFAGEIDLTPLNARIMEEPEVGKRYRFWGDEPDDEFNNYEDCLYMGVVPWGHLALNKMYEPLYNKDPKAYMSTTTYDNMGAIPEEVEKVHTVKYELLHGKITKDGHTMFLHDVVSDLNRKAFLEAEERARKEGNNGA